MIWTRCWEQYCRLAELGNDRIVKEEGEEKIALTPPSPIGMGEGERRRASAGITSITRFFRPALSENPLSVDVDSAALRAWDARIDRSLGLCS